jgi:hypothetical protein
MKYLETDFIKVLNKEHKRSKIFSITCNVNTLHLVCEWCDKNKVKLLLHDDIEDYSILTTYFDYDEQSIIWIMNFTIENEKYCMQLFKK